MMKDSPNQLSLFDVGPAATAPTATAAKEKRRAAPLGGAEVSVETKDTASQLSRLIRLGTSSWSFPGWAGIVYDRDASEQRLAREGLAAYAQHPVLRTVGIDRTYYAPIPAEAFAAYAAVVPADFRFLVKAHEMCTMARFSNHPRSGARRGQVNDRFLHAGYATAEVVGPCLDGLGEKLGVLVFQFPPQPLAMFASAANFAERLHEFLKQLPRGPLYAVEIRNAELLTTEYVQALRANGAVHCLNVHPTMPGIRTQAKLACDAESPALVVRWMLHSGFKYEEAKARYAPFNAIVDEDSTARDAIADLCRTAAQRGVGSYVVINNKAEGSAPLSALRLAQEIVTTR